MQLKVSQSKCVSLPPDRPGFTRLNLPYFISEEQLDFVLQAVAMVTEHGWKLLPQVIDRIFNYLSITYIRKCLTLIFTDMTNKKTFKVKTVVITIFVVVAFGCF